MKFKVILQQEGPRGTIYSLIEENSDSSEIEKAFDEYAEYRGEEHLEELQLVLWEMCKKFSFRIQRFRDENLTGKEGVYALGNTGDYRFYLYHDATERIMLTGGGVKKVKRFQDDPKLNFVVNYLYSISKLLWENRELSLKGLCERGITIEVDWTGVITNEHEILEGME